MICYLTSGVFYYAHGNVNKVDKQIRELTADLFGQAEAQVPSTGPTLDGTSPVIVAYFLVCRKARSEDDTHVVDLTLTIIPPNTQVRPTSR